MLFTYKLTYKELGIEKVKEFESEREMYRFINALENEYEDSIEESLAEFNIEKFEVAPDKIVFINIYSVTRCYGGPEEGGWWYDNFHCEEIMPVQYQYADVLKKELHERYEKTHKWGDISSVLGGQDVAVYIEKTPKKSETKGKPVYE